MYNILQKNKVFKKIYFDTLFFYDIMCLYMKNIKKGNILM